MFEILTKKAYWDAIEDPLVSSLLSKTSRQMICLKHIQDAWILSKIGSAKGKKIVEIGGGFGRILRTLEGNARWNLDRVNGEGRSVDEKRRVMPKEYHVVDVYLGDFSEKVPSNYFDIAFSVSVIEHIPLSGIDNFFLDHHRILNEGGFGFHAIDFYLGNAGIAGVESRLDAYLSGIEKSGLHLVAPPMLSRPLIFDTSFASNPDLTMLHWNKIVPKLAKQRANLQSVNLSIGVTKKI